VKKPWKHPQLGTFKFDEERECWVGACRLPAFTVFHFKWEAHVPAPAARHALMFDGTEGREPSAGAVKLALHVIAQESKLPALVTSALWEEFNGHGPKSAMWWYGDMGQVAEAFGCAERPRPTRPHDLLSAMRSRELVIHESLYEYKKPIAELSFSALFEPEHGVGVLTDGSKILGTGYSGDVLPYRMQARSASPAPQPGARRGLEKAPRATPPELVAALEKEMRKMAAECAALISGPQEEKRRWEKLFPAPPPGARVKTDPSILYGDWKLDPAETARVLTKLGEKTSAAQARRNWPNHRCRISKKAVRYFDGDDLFDEQAFRECRRRGNRVSILLDTGSTWDCWCDGELLVDDTGLAWRRASRSPRDSQEQR
jgi:hypothetical protein